VVARIGLLLNLSLLEQSMGVDCMETDRHYGMVGVRPGLSISGFSLLVFHCVCSKFSKVVGSGLQERDFRLSICVGVSLLRAIYHIVVETCCCLLDLYHYIIEMV
jgi:hypothetical protein